MSQTRHINVLLVEDEDSDAQLVRQCLLSTKSVQFEITRIKTFSEMQRTIKNSLFDVILLDLSLPDSEGLETISKTRLMSGMIPIVVLTGFNDTDFALSALEAGAADYMIKGDFGHDGLVRVIRYALLRAEMDARNNLMVAALEAAANGIVIMDQDARIKWVNPAFSRITGYALDEVLERNLNELVKSGLHDEAFYKEMWINLKAGKTWRGELVNKHKDGSLYHEELSIAPVKNQLGEITHFIGIKENISVRKHLQKQLLNLACTDSLTGLVNRRVFLENLKQEAARLERTENHQATLLMLDIDHFKRINDTYGHATGDKILQLFAQIILKNSRSIDMPGRLGGEEFAIILPGSSLEDAIAMAERLREQVASAVFHHEKGDVHFTVSIGVAQLLRGDINGEASLNRADLALYAAKNTGRNQTRWLG